MDVFAKARYIRMSPRKVRLLVDLVRGMKVSTAEAQLSFSRRAAALPLLKLIKSAAANAEHNFKLNQADLLIKTLTVDGGPVLKRFRPRAFGRAATIRKRTSHITVVLTDGKAAAVKDTKKKPAASGVPSPKKTPAETVSSKSAAAAAVKAKS